MPLSSAQESLYFLNQLTNGRPVYNMPLAFELDGKVNVSALENALKFAVERHPALRSEVIGEKLVVRPGNEFKLIRQDLSSVPCDQRKAAVQEAINRAIKLFSLRGELPFRAHLFVLSEENHILLLDLHHLVGDMTSLVVLCREISEAYSALVSGEASLTAEPLGVEVFTDSSGQSNRGSDEADFWRSLLAGFPPDFELPLDRRRPRLPTFSGGIIVQPLSAELAAGLKRTARASKCSLFVLVLAAFQSLLYRYTGETRFCIGTPFSLRDDPALEEAVSYLVNLLPIPCELTGSESFECLLQRVRKTVIAMQPHCRSSFRDILREIGMSPESPKPSLARVVFQYFPEAPVLKLNSIHSVNVPVHSRTSKFDLCLSLWTREDSLVIELEFDTDIFDRSSVERLAVSFQTLLQSVVTYPTAAVQDLQLLTDGDRQLLEKWTGNTAAEYPRELLVHQLFEAQAAMHPDRTALVSEDRLVPYGELNSMATTIARNLMRHGIRDGDFVGVCLRRSPEFIAVLIGILKAGAAFVPFDESYPRARLDYLFADSGVRILIAEETTKEIAPAGISVLDVQELLSSCTVESVREKRIESSPGPQVAYLMYTSGSTGKPKGVLVPHRGVLRLARGNDFISIGSDEVFLAFAPISFDASTFEIWAPLLNGATLAIYPAEFRSLDQFHEILKSHRVTCLWLTAGLFNMIVDRDVYSLSGICQLLVGGDVLSVPHIHKALAALPSTRLVNGYGPTENTTFTCCFSIPRDWPVDRSVPIGKPIRNTQVYILDEQLKPAPIGAIGELCTGGDGLSLGYWNQPELTAARFVSNPFARSSEDLKLYRTGDRARFLPDGNIEFLGRRDSQVKIRGFRVELGEVEAAFRSLPFVQDVVVVAEPDTRGSKDLIAYVVPTAGLQLNVSQVRARLEAILPRHTCPSFILFLEALPIGPTGKIDRLALPKPERVKMEGEISCAPNPIEERLIEIWKQILDISNLGAEANFFECGGDSLRAMRVINRINVAFQCDMPFSRIFEAPTIREMAVILEAEVNRSSRPTEPRPAL